MMIARCPALAIHAATMALGVDCTPQPQASASPTPRRQPAARTRRSGLEPRRETWLK